MKSMLALLGIIYFMIILHSWSVGTETFYLIFTSNRLMTGYLYPTGLS